MDAVSEQPGRWQGREWSSSSRPLIRRVFVAWIVTRAAYIILTYAANLLSLFPKHPGLYGMVQTWQRWDVNWFLIVSRHGYPNAATANFFPLFPATMGAISWLLGDGSAPTATHVLPGNVVGPPDRVRMLVGLGLTNIALLVGLYAIARLAELGSERGDAGASMRAVWITLAYPFAWSWTAPYAEGFFLAFAALTLLWARQGRWYLAALVALLAGLTRSLAAILIVPLVWEFARQRDWLKRVSRHTPFSWRAVRSAVPGVVVAAAVPAGMSLFFGYLYLRFHDFLLPLHTQLKFWDHRPMAQWTSFWIAFQYLFKYGASGNGLLAVDLALIIGSALIIIVAVRQVPLSYTLYMVGFLYLITAAPFIYDRDIFTGTPRYLASAIPIFLILAQWSGTRPWLEKSLIAGGFMLQAVFTVGFFNFSYIP